MLSAQAGDTCMLIRHGPLTLDLTGYKLLANDRAEPLTSAQVRLLAALMREPTSVQSLQALASAMGRSGPASDEALKVGVSRLRSCLRRLDCDQRFLHSVRGVGYIFDPGIA